jgi:excinuclease ABC subunit B
VETLERIGILRDLRLGNSMCWSASTCCAKVWTCPKSRWLRFSTRTRKASCARILALIQTIGRAARNANGRVIMYADKMTESMRRALGETERRRVKQIAYNLEHGITPQSIIKPIEATLVTAYEADYFKVPVNLEAYDEYGPEKLKETIAQLEYEMRAAAKDFKFEQAAELRDKIKYLRERELAVA